MVTEVPLTALTWPKTMLRFANPGGGLKLGLGRGEAPGDGEGITRVGQPVAELGETLTAVATIPPAAFF